MTTEMTTAGRERADEEEPRARSPKRYSPEEREAALEVYRADGLAVAHRVSGVSKSQLRKWAMDVGLDPSALAGAAVERTAAANVARGARIAETRLELQELLMTQAVSLLERMDEPHVEYLGREALQRQFDRAPASSCRNYAISAAVLIDKFRLEMGEATARTEEVPAETVLANVQQTRDDLADRRERQQQSA